MKAILFFGMLVGIALGGFLLVFPFTDVGHSISGWYTIVALAIGGGIVIATAVLVRSFLFPELFRKTFPLGYAVVLEDLRGESKVMLRSGLVRPTWIERGRLSRNPFRVHVDTSKESVKLHGADNQLIDAVATIWLDVPEEEDAIKIAADQFAEPVKKEERIAFFEGVLRELLSEAVKNVRVDKWEETRDKAIESCQSRIRDEVKNYGHRVKTSGDVRFRQARITQDAPTLEESRLISKNEVEQTENRKETETKKDEIRKAQEESKARTDREIVTAQESNKRIALDARIETTNREAEGELQKTENTQKLELAKENNEAEKNRLKVKNEGLLVEDRKELTTSQLELLATEQEMAEKKGEYERTQKYQESVSEKEIAQNKADEEFLRRTIDQRLLQEAVKCRQQVLAQNKDYPGADLAVELRKTELQLAKEVVLAQAKVMAASWNNVRMNIVSDTDSATRIAKEQIDALASAGKLTEYVNTIVNDKTIQDVTENVFSTLGLQSPFSERGKEEGDGEAQKEKEDRDF